MNRLLPLLLLLAFPCHALEVALANPVTLTVVVDKLDLYEELDGVDIGNDRPHVTRYSFARPIQVETNGVTVVGTVRLEIAVTQATKDLATAEGTGKTFDALTRTKQVATSRAQAMLKVRPALVAAKARVERPTQP